MKQPYPSSPAWFFHRWHGERRLGVLDPQRFSPAEAFIDLGRAEATYLLGTGGLTSERLQELGPIGKPMPGAPRFDVPVLRASKILCLGKNFVEHAKEFGDKVPEEPLFFNKLPETLVPNNGTVVLPHWLDTRIDHEVELAVIIGFPDPDHTGRKYVSVDDAMDLVAGYTVLNDITARKIQGEDRESQKPWLRCKNFDTFLPIGPWVVAKEDMPDIAERKIRMTVNGEIRQEAMLSDMVVDIPNAIAYLSRHTTLRPGDIIAMGTPAGVGPIEDGDEMMAEINGIGQLVNTVRRESAPE